MRDGWRKGYGMSDLLGKRPSRSTLGIIGMGRIGRAVARRARGSDILHGCDILSLRLPGRPEPALMMREMFAAMPKGAVFVNTARGPPVDEDALIGVLQSGHLFAAGLDVFRREPEFDLRFATLPNVFLTPHVASATFATHNAMGNRALDNIVAVLTGRPPQDPA